LQALSSSPPARWSSCPVCAAGEHDSYVRFPELEFVRCRACGVVYKGFEVPTIRPADFYEAAYFHGRKSARDKRFEHRVGKARRQILAALEYVPARSLLDVGCSFGYVIEAGKRLGLDSAGMDISEYAVRVCRERGYRAEVGALESMPWQDGEFDVVLLKHVIEHTPEPKRALAELRRITSPRGVLVVAVPNLDYWKGRWQRRRYRYFRPDDLGSQHYVYYTTETLSRLLEDAGFQVRCASKAQLRRRVASAAPLRWPLELGRYAALAAWQGVAALSMMRRELFVVAQKA
jgi:SAM-dependent methyltransferase